MHFHLSLTGPRTDRKLDSILDGRRSFPSGHSSIAFASMMFLSLWIAGATGAWRLTEPVPSGFHRSKFGRVFLSLVPLVFATWVAVSRVEDYVGVNAFRNC